VYCTEYMKLQKVFLTLHPMGVTGTKCVTILLVWHYGNQKIQSLLQRKHTVSITKNLSRIDIGLILSWQPVLTTKKTRHHYKELQQNRHWSDNVITANPYCKEDISPFTKITLLMPLGLFLFCSPIQLKNMTDQILTHCQNHHLIAYSAKIWKISSHRIINNHNHPQLKYVTDRWIERAHKAFFTYTKR
jgi:hypothetical protein